MCVYVCCGRSLQVLDRALGEMRVFVGARDGVECRGARFFFLWVGVVVKCLIAARGLLALPWRATLSRRPRVKLPLSLIRASNPVMKPSLAQGVKVKLSADIVNEPVLPCQDPPCLSPQLTASQPNPSVHASSCLTRWSCRCVDAPLSGRSLRSGEGVYPPPVTCRMLAGGEGRLGGWCLRALRREVWSLLPLCSWRCPIKDVRVVILEV